MVMKLRITSQEGGRSSVEVSGKVIQKYLSVIPEPLKNLLGEDCYKGIVLLDLHAIDEIDSSGIGWLLACHKRFRRQGGCLVLHSLTSFASDIMRILKMQLVFNLAENEAAARRACPEHVGDAAV
jgi:anti-anti-sigma factor